MYSHVGSAGVTFWRCQGNNPTYRRPCHMWYTTANVHWIAFAAFRRGTGMIDATIDDLARVVEHGKAELIFGCTDVTVWRYQS